MPPECYPRPSIENLSPFGKQWQDLHRYFSPTAQHDLFDYDDAWLATLSRRALFVYAAKKRGERNILKKRSKTVGDAARMNAELSAMDNNPNLPPATTTGSEMKDGVKIEKSNKVSAKLKKKMRRVTVDQTVWEAGWYWIEEFLELYADDLVLYASEDRARLTKHEVMVDIIHDHLESMYLLELIERNQ